MIIIIILIIIIMKKNVIDAVPMVTMSQSAANWRNTQTHVDRSHSPTHNYVCPSVIV